VEVAPPFPLSSLSIADSWIAAMPGEYRIRRGNDDYASEATGQARGSLHCGSQRFESPPLHQDVRENSGGFRTSKIIGRYRGLARLAPVIARVVLFSIQKRRVYARSLRRSGSASGWPRSRRD
jgi:hypothetical protein